MSDPGPFGGRNPFEAMFGDLAKLFAGQGPISWDFARQLAQWTATEGQPEPNPEPVERIRMEELLRVAEMHVAEISGLATTLTGGVLSPLTVTRGEWARRALDAHRPLLEQLATSLTPPPDPEQGTVPDPSTDLLGGLGQVIGPLLMGMQAGFMMGHLARRSLGQYDLPLPWPASDELLMVPANLDAFAEEWSVPADDLRLWVCLHEVVHHAVLGRPHVRARLQELLVQYAAGFQADASGLEEQFGAIDPSDPESLQAAFGDPEKLLGAIQSDAQRALLPLLAALTAAITGYADHVIEATGSRLIGSFGQLTEALHRRRVEAAAGDTYVARLLGLELSQAHCDRGVAFVAGIVDRAGEEALAELWESERTLPTPAEIDAPGLWLARIDLPDE